MKQILSLFFLLMMPNSSICFDGEEIFNKWKNITLEAAKSLYYEDAKEELNVVNKNSLANYKSKTISLKFFYKIERLL